MSDQDKRPAIEAAEYNANAGTKAKGDMAALSAYSLSAIAFALIAIHKQLEDLNRSMDYVAGAAAAER